MSGADWLAMADPAVPWSESRRRAGGDSLLLAGWQCFGEQAVIEKAKMDVSVVKAHINLGLVPADARTRAGLGPGSRDLF